MNTFEKDLTPSSTPAQQRIKELQAILDDLRPKLVAAEQQLSQQLAEISAFEFLVRSRLEPLSRRLEALQSEIEELQKTLHRLRADFFIADSFDGGDLYDVWRSSEEAGAAASGEFRYHEAPAKPPKKTLTLNQDKELKRLFRKLARRFHPDFALNEEDRLYRTSIMMAINAAYTAGNLQRLRELSDQPDPQRPDFSDEEFAEALLREVHHCRRRIAEIDKELAQLFRHPSYLLKKRTEQATLRDRDLLAQLSRDLRNKIAERMAQRDVLEEEIANFENGEPELFDEAAAEAVFNLGLEHVLIEESDSGISEWRDRNRSRLDDSETDVELEWEALRRARGKK